MTTFIINGDTSPLEGASTIETLDAVLVEFAEGGVVRRLSVARCEGGAWDEGWLVLPVRET